jgi:hypothetical protein
MTNWRAVPRDGSLSALNQSKLRSHSPVTPFSMGNSKASVPVKLYPVLPWQRRFSRMVASTVISTLKPSKS